MKDPNIAISPNQTHLDLHKQPNPPKKNSNIPYRFP